MAGYNEIRGLRVKYLSADPSNAEDGQVWYNSTTGNLRVQGIGSGAWSSSSNALVGRDTAASTGPQTSALVFGGATPSRTTATEEYNGSGWSTGGVLPTATTGMGSARNASQTAALGMCSNEISTQPLQYATIQKAVRASRAVNNSKMYLAINGSSA